MALKEPVTLDYFQGHGRGLQIRMILTIGGADWKDNALSFAEYPTHKPKYTYKQVPAIFLADGTQIAQSYTIMRYLGRKLKGPEGEFMYPGHHDPEASYRIDEQMSIDADFFSRYNPFLLPFLPQYKEKDEHFSQFIVKFFPEYLANLEARMTDNNWKYTCGNTMTIADCSVASMLFKLVSNDKFEHNLILKVVMDEKTYPKCNKFLKTMENHFSNILANSNYPF